MSRYTISVVCPITQMANRLTHVQSWLDQLTFYDAQVILVHDKRDEETSQQLKLLTMGQDPRRVLLIEGQYGSAGAARNQGLAHVNAEWVCFWDSDDIPEVASVIQAIQTSSVSEVIVGQFMINRSFSSCDFETVTPKKTVQVFDLVGNPGIWRFAFRHEIIRDLLFPVFPLGEDQAFLAQIPWGTVRLQFNNEIFYNYCSGTTHQLTKNKHLIPELETSVQFLAKTPRIDKVQSSLIDAMIIRQSITLLKYLAFVDQKKFLLSLKSVVKFVFKSTHRGVFLRYYLGRLVN